MTTPHPPPSAPFPVPDYAGASLLNLTASIVRALGGRSPYPECRFLRASALRPFRRIVLLLVDGLGESQLADYLSSPAARRRSPFFAVRPRHVIDTVAPATTASVVTTVSTGAAPAAHAILGWHLHLPDLGLDATPLPYVTRVGAPLAPPDFPLSRYLAIPAPMSTTRARRWLLSTRGIPTSPLSLAQPWWHERRDYLTLPGLVRALRAFAAAPARRAFAYAYWPHYDSVCHAAGPLSRPARAHLAEIDAALARAAAALAPSRTLLLVTADHGLVPVRRTIRLARIPGFLSTLATLPSGDARCTHFFVRPSRVPDFLAAFQKAPLAGAGALVTGADYLSSGMLGPLNRRAHPSLADRVGDYVFLAAPGVILQSSPPHDPSTFRPKGHHSGLTPEETRIPLFVVPPPP